MLYRSNNNANAEGGVSYANANNDASNSNANNGSRLALNKWQRLYSIQGNGSGRRVAHRRPREGSHSNSGEGNNFLHKPES